MCFNQGQFNRSPDPSSQKVVVSAASSLLRLKEGTLKLDQYLRQIKFLTSSQTL